MVKVRQIEIVDGNSERLMRLFKPNVEKLAMNGNVKRLIKALANSDYNVRRSAALALGSIKDDSAVEPLIKALADSDYNVRRNAAEALGDIKDCRAVVPLSECARRLKTLITPSVAGQQKRWVV